MSTCEARICGNCTLFSAVRACSFPCNKCINDEARPMHTKRPKAVGDLYRVFANAASLDSHVLQVGDYVQFRDILYEVQEEWLQNLSVESNSKVWEAVGLYNDRHRIGKAFYGDDADPYGDWPTYRIESHAEGLTKLVQWLLHQLEFPEYKSERRCLNCVYAEMPSNEYPCDDCGFDKFLDARGFLSEDPDSGDTDDKADKDEGYGDDKEEFVITCITCIRDLDRVPFLNNRQEIKFGEHSCHVHWRGSDGHLSFPDYMNDIVFRELGVDADEFCSEVWGRETDGSGVFPYFKSQQEARAVIRALYEALERKAQVDAQVEAQGEAAGPRSFVSSKELAGEVLRPDDVLYIQSVKYEVVGEEGRWYLFRVTPDCGRNGVLFREFDLNAWELMYNIGLSQDSCCIDKAPSECFGWPEADTLENLTKFVHIVYALTTVYQVGHCKGQAIGRDDYKAETERKILNAIKVLQQ